MTRTINISLNVPESYQVEELTRQLTEYGERLIARKTSVRKSRSRPSADFLKGFSLLASATSEQLIDDYLKDKYNL